MKWLYKNWYNGTIFTAIYLTALLFLFVKDASYPLFLIWLQMVAYLLHQFEEYVCPGGFQRTFNQVMIGSPHPDEPLTDKLVFWINVPVVFLAYPLTAVLAQFTTVGVGLWTAYFAIVNAAGHVGMAAKMRKYNPGFAVSLCLNIPLGIYALWYWNHNGLASVPQHVVGILIALAIQAALMVWGLGVLRPRYRNKNR